MKKCRRCRVDIIWARTVRGGSIPLDYRTDGVEGDLFAVVGGVAVVVRQVQRVEFRSNGARLYAPHTRLCRLRSAAARRIA